MQPPTQSRFFLLQLLRSEAASGVLLMLVAALAIAIANSPLSSIYFEALHLPLGPLSLHHWINDALMVVFFLMVGLEIKREMLVGQLSSWSRRILPGAAALGGMAGPAVVYLAFANQGEAARGWAIPSATDIAFALGVLSLLGNRVPLAIKVFVAALAIIDDLGAVIVIALFYTAQLSLWDLAGAGVAIAALALMNRRGVQHLLPYMILGLVLWVFVLRSGVHATLAGVILAMFIPLQGPDSENTPLLRLEHLLHRPVAFLVVPIFGFANAGVSFAGVSADSFLAPVTLGVTAGLMLGKFVGIFGAVALMVGLGIGRLPMGANWLQMAGVACLCGIGFTMSLFIALLAFADPVLQDQAKLGILTGSSLAGLLGYAILRMAPQKTTP